ncbi:MAG: pyruvate ferredoxin oxidoreductase [Peptostreptococcaceae bacterium]|nr:pyruvate ferredoxin oxidoreductase [Peptostreptococcaceae bacterium]
MEKNIKFICGDDAVAEGVRLSRPHVISAYPITPQTIVVERLSELVEDGSLKAEYMHVESEHSAMSCAIGISAVGARAFTATSSQGLLYMAEALPYASGQRLPIVMMNANRSIATPWSIFGDHMDSMFLLNSGWIQFYVEDAQEALDMTIQAYRIAETKEVMTPVMVNVDGFVLTHTYEMVEIPEQEKVDEFLPPISMPCNSMSLENHKSLCISAGKDTNMEFNMKRHFEMLESENYIEAIDKEFGDAFGRYYHGMMETVYMEDADVALITTGSVTGTARVVLEEMRKAGKKVGLIKLRVLRPFPMDKMVDALKNVKAFGVLDKNISFGYEGTIFTNVNSSIVAMEKLPKAINFIGGIGGKDITHEDIKKAYDGLLSAAGGNSFERVQYMNVGCDY